ncbi:MAG TPA: 3-oxoacyl-[acyl-carrier-protein] synthase III C-terminal domain-containing protein [Patescibacteria group bacterium]|nr:3-oxoacyl-[acyl-carrier-protein] synthase III C-terminal domain-containing protein [Patescibacteria group bacterium]
MLKLVGTASWMPEIVVSSDDLARALGLEEKKTHGWVGAKTGIVSRRLAVTIPDLEPVLPDGFRSSSEAVGTLARRVLEETQTSAGDIGGLFLVTCTPDEPFLGGTAFATAKKLGLPEEAVVFEVQAGCAGLVQALDLAATYATKIPFGKKILVSAVNLTSPFFGAGGWRRYIEKKGGLWSALMFADGAVALLFENSESEDPPRGILYSNFCATRGSPLVQYPAGGVACPTREENIGDHLFLMDPQAVAREYPAAMTKNIDELRGGGYSPEMFKRIFLHQAVPPAVKLVRQALGLDEEVVPVRGDIWGNSSASVTGLMLDEALKNGELATGDLVALSVVGAPGVRGVAVIKI